MADAPAGLGDRGLTIWERYAGGDAGVNALALEAARAADRLDELDNVIQGKGVLELMQFRLRDLPDLDADEPTWRVEVQFQSVLAETRQQQAGFSAMIGRLAAMEAPKGAAAPAAAHAAAVHAGGNVTPLQAARSAATR